MKYFVLMKDYDYEGYGPPIGLFISEQRAKEYAYEYETNRRKKWSVPCIEKEDFMNSFQYDYLLEETEVIE